MVTSTGRAEDLLFSILIQLVVMIGAARIMNLVFRRFGQPGVIGETVAGLLLGPSLFGHFFPGLSASVFGTQPAPAIVILSQIGLVLLMFQIGMNFEFGQLREARARRALLPIAAASVAAPFGLGIGLGHLSAPHFAAHIPVAVYALFCGVALAITAVPVLGRILAEFGMTREELGVLAISAAAINDIAGWILLASVSAVATATFTPAAMALQLAGLLGFVLLCLFVLRPAARLLLEAFPVRDGELPPTLMAVLLIAVFVLGMCTFKLGIFTIFGGFAGGLLVHHDRAFVEAWRKQVGSFVLVFFLPVFFTFTGLRTNLLGLAGTTDWSWLAIFTITATLGKIVPVFLAARSAGYGGAAAGILGALMNARGLMELIVLNIGLETGFIPQKIFTMLVIMAVATTLMAGPLLKLLMPRAGLAVPRGIEA
ncbi:MAG: cation:proton antiporter [Rhodospirillales bacterium]|nr:cation:proton antiporter [Rhodospirillales bacterium]MDE2318445.1 cation:proton antiporter [Rhodospirillales bacterium]